MDCKGQAIRVARHALFFSLIFIGFFILGSSVHAAVNAQVTMEKNNEWGDGFQGSVTIQNTGSSEINGWTLSFDADFEIQQIWNARIVSQNGTQYIIESAGYNDVITPNGERNFGFIATPGGSSMPVMFTVNGEQTEGGSDSTPFPEPTPTTPSARRARSCRSPIRAP
jgi:hypothetical protein